MSLNNDLLFSADDDEQSPSSPTQPNSLLSEELIQQQEEEENIDYETVDSHLSSSSRNNNSSSTEFQQNSNQIQSKDRFIEILARDEDEPEAVHANDYSYILSALVITTEPTYAKLACQAIDKCCGRNSNWVIPAASALSNLLTGTPDRGLKISCAQALNRIVKLSSLESSSITTLVTLLQIAIACNSADRLLTRPLQEGLDSLKKPEENVAATKSSNPPATKSSNPPATQQISSSSDYQQAHSSPRHEDHSSSANSVDQRGYSYDLPSDVTVTEEQLKALGTIPPHLWKGLRYKLQRFFVPNVTTPQKLDVHSFLMPVQLEGLMRLAGFSCPELDFFTKQHWDKLVEAVDRIYDGKESRLDPYLRRPRDLGNHHSSIPDQRSYNSSAPPHAFPPNAPPPYALPHLSAPPPHVERHVPPDTQTDPSAPTYPKFLVLQGIPASHGDPMDIYDFLKMNNILFHLDKRDIIVTVPVDPLADHTASIRFQTHEDAVEAYNKITNTMYYNQKILYVDYSMTVPARVLFMYKIIRYVTKESLAEGLKSFCKQGTVEKVDLPMNSSFGYITLTEIDDAIRVYRTLLKSPEGGLWIPVADSNCGEQVLVFFKYSKFPDPPRGEPEKYIGNGKRNLCILRISNLHEHDLTDLESICKRSGECNRVNISKGNAVYQFKYADGAQQALVALQNSLKHLQASLVDLGEYHGRTDDQDRGTGGYDPSKVRTGYQDRGGGSGGRGHGRETYSSRDSYRDRRDDRPPYDSFSRPPYNDHRYDDRRYDTNSRRNDDTTRRPYNRDDDSRRFNTNDVNRNDRSADKPYNRHDSGREIEVDFNYNDGDERSGEQQSTPRVERSVVDSWKDQDDDDNNGNYEQHHRRSRWGEDNADAGEFDRRNDGDDTRKRARSASPNDQSDDKRPKPVVPYDQRTWERENIQAQYNRSRGRGGGGGRGRGFSRHETYR